MAPGQHTGHQLGSKPLSREAVLGLLLLLGIGLALVGVLYAAYVAMTGFPTEGAVRALSAWC